MRDDLGGVREQWVIKDMQRLCHLSKQYFSILGIPFKFCGNGSNTCKMDRGVVTNKNYNMCSLLSKMK